VPEAKPDKASGPILRICHRANRAWRHFYADQKRNVFLFSKQH
jgi:hypothetical protein